VSNYNPALGKSPTCTGLTGATGSGPNATNPNAGAYGGDAMLPITGIMCSHWGGNITSANLPIYLYVDWIRFSVLNAN
jgi:hypothetical protein